MDKVKNIRFKIIRYLIPCFIVCFAGTVIIKVVMSDFFIQYQSYFFDTVYNKLSSGQIMLYSILEYGDYILIPLWSVFCLWYTASLFYNREISKPLNVLMDASEKILGGDLDFRVEKVSDNELGMLCSSFEELRENLYASNYNLWKSLEEKKRLNSAFSHDLRTPITVLKGYTELMIKMGDTISSEKRSEIMSKMSGQVTRLENYTEKMSCIHKMEDIIPDIRNIEFKELCTQLNENGKMLCADCEFAFASSGNADAVLHTDSELIIQVFMNLVSNALRYKKSRIECLAELRDSTLKISVSDDGSGFSDEALRKACQPFYRDGDANDKEHFGLGLYICRILCRKTGGDITIENNKDGGGKVTAVFSKEI